MPWFKRFSLVLIFFSYVLPAYAEEKSKDDCQKLLVNVSDYARLFQMALHKNQLTISDLRLAITATKPENPFQFITPSAANAALRDGFNRILRKPLEWLKIQKELQVILAQRSGQQEQIKVARIETVKVFNPKKVGELSTQEFPGISQIFWNPEPGKLEILTFVRPNMEENFEALKVKFGPPFTQSTGSIPIRLISDPQWAQQIDQKILGFTKRSIENHYPRFTNSAKSVMPIVDFMTNQTLFTPEFKWQGWSNPLVYRLIRRAHKAANGDLLLIVDKDVHYEEVVVIPINRPRKWWNKVWLREGPVYQGLEGKNAPHFVNLSDGRTLIYTGKSVFEWGKSASKPVAATPAAPILRSWQRVQTFALEDGEHLVAFTGGNGYGVQVYHVDKKLKFRSVMNLDWSDVKAEWFQTSDGRVFMAVFGYKEKSAAFVQIFEPLKSLAPIWEKELPRPRQGIHFHVKDWHLHWAPEVPDLESPLFALTVFDDLSMDYQVYGLNHSSPLFSVPAMSLDGFSSWVWKAKGDQLYFAVRQSRGLVRVFESLSSVEEP